MLIGTKDFSGGMNQLLDSRSLPSNVAAFCANLDLSSKAFTPLRGLGTGTRGSATVGGSARVAFFAGGWRTFSVPARVMRHPDTDRYLWMSAGHEPRQATAGMLAGEGFRRFGIPAPEPKPTVAVSGECGEDLLRSTVYVYTLVTDMGEESGFSAPSSVVDVYTGQAVTVSGFSKSVPANTTLAQIRVYRAETDDYGEASFQFVGEIPAEASAFVDDDAEAGAVGIMRAWLHPPATMSNFCLMQNGMVAGMHSASGDAREILLSEPGYPYAFPMAYRLKAPRPVLNLASVGGALVALTDEFPCLIHASAPETAQLVPLARAAAPLSSDPDSVAWSQFGVTFPSHDGLCNVTESGSVELVTSGLLSRDDWQALGPAQMRVAVHDDKVFLFCLDAAGENQGGVYTATSPSFTMLRGVAHAVHGAFVDFETDELYVLYSNDGDSARRIGCLGAADAAPLVARWESGVTMLPSAQSFSIMRVLGDFSGGRTLDVTVRRDGAPVLTRTLTKAGEYRLPAGLYREFSYVLSGTATVFSAEFAGSAEELTS